ncbi:MAG: leucine-rich repeat domain-containing protein [Bacteroidales bacterium]|nr:leucine-rich repeat domain-containing protein [Bacteroidales bacterium]
MFAGCSNLISLSVAKENRVYNSEKSCNAIIENATNILIAGCSSTIIPQYIKEINDAAFFNFSELITINIPDGVTKIGDGAFYGCSSLKSINIPASVNKIGKYAFDGCSSLKLIYVTKELNEKVKEMLPKELYKAIEVKSKE